MNQKTALNITVIVKDKVMRTNYIDWLSNKNILNPTSYILNFDKRLSMAKEFLLLNRKNTARFQKLG